MRSWNRQQRPDDLIEKMGQTLTPEEKKIVWNWIASIEEEATMARVRLAEERPNLKFLPDHFDWNDEQIRILWKPTMSFSSIRMRRTPQRAEEPSTLSLLST